MHRQNFRLFLLLLLTMILVVIFYVSRERTIYYWDFIGYQRTMINQVNNFYESPLKPLEAARLSLRDEYNALFTLPLLPIMLLLGNTASRQTYILSLALVYLLPYLFVIGWISKRIIPNKTPDPFRIAVILALITPSVWLPTLRGYPDTGSAILVGLATLIYVYDDDLKSWWQIPTIGFCLMGAVLFRRHFGYSAVAFFISATLIKTIQRLFQRDEDAPLPGVLFTDIKRIAAIGLVSGLLLLVVGYPFLEKIAKTNYKVLYKSFEVTPPDVLRYFVKFYGWPTLILAIIGYLPTRRPQKVAANPKWFVAFFGLVTTILWTGWVRQNNPHYSLHFTLPIVIGLILFVYKIIKWSEHKWGTILCIGLSVFLFSNTLYWLRPEIFPQHQLYQRLFTTGTQPLQRSDYDQIVALTEHLREIAGDHEAIYVVDSAVNNNDLIRSAEQSLHPGNLILNVLESPQVDSRDFYPLETLLKADYVILSSPLQIHLAEEEQGVVSSVFYAFQENWAIAKDFKRLPARYALNYGIETSIYERLKATSPETAVETLYKIRETVGKRPGNQPDWIQITNLSADSGIHANENGHQIQTLLSNSSPHKSTMFLYLGAIPPGGTLSGQFQTDTPGCPGIKFSLLSADQTGTITGLMENATLSNSGFAFRGFPIPGENSYLLLAISPAHESQTLRGCEITVNDLSFTTP